MFVQDSANVHGGVVLAVEFSVRLGLPLSKIVILSETIVRAIILENHTVLACQLFISAFFVVGLVFCFYFCFWLEFCFNSCKFHK